MINPIEEKFKTQRMQPVLLNDLVRYFAVILNRFCVSREKSSSLHFYMLKTRTPLQSYSCSIQTIFGNPWQVGPDKKRISTDFICPAGYFRQGGADKVRRSRTLYALTGYSRQDGQIKSEDHGIYMPLQTTSDKVGQIKSEDHGIYMPLQDISGQDGADKIRKAMEFICPCRIF